MNDLNGAGAKAYLNNQGNVGVKASININGTESYIQVENSLYNNVMTHLTAFAEAMLLQSHSP
ncbi:hypothetical protein CWB98_06330 [Pseudoalteromonas rubra]|uniref:Uncharacterized protein n=1 Tax=Pseudoalteromonas rubra TaxID=43658 RepID=A0A5S3X3J6_9GAMM|nr:hypothetical protein CWB98_06330 [Pseudoalteromonas rubra]